MPVLIARDGKTYVTISEHTNTQDKKSVFESVHLRTPWLDENIKIATKEKTQAVFSSQTDLFGGYIGSNGKEIPAYILKSVTINYFGKNIVPKIQADIARIETEIVRTRKHMIAEVAQKKVAPNKVSGSETQKNRLAKK